jgi:hypothetical protein
VFVGTIDIFNVYVSHQFQSLNNNNKIFIVIQISPQKDFYSVFVVFNVIILCADFQNHIKKSAQFFNLLVLLMCHFQSSPLAIADRLLAVSTQGPPTSSSGRVKPKAGRVSTLRLFLDIHQPRFFQ